MFSSKKPLAFRSVAENIPEELWEKRFENSAKSYDERASHKHASHDSLDGQRLLEMAREHKISEVNATEQASSNKEDIVPVDQKESPTIYLDAPSLAAPSSSPSPRQKRWICQNWLPFKICFRFNIQS